MRPLTVGEPIARSAVWSGRLALFAIALAGVAVGLSRFHFADPRAALTVFGAALTIAILAALLAATATVVIWREGIRGAGQAAGGFVLSLALLAYPTYLAGVAFALPRIAQVSTDLESPPPFLLSSKARAARAGTEPPPLIADTRAAQRRAYPDLETIRVEMDPSGAYDLALDVAKELGWRVVDSEPPNLAGDGSALIEATSRSLFFGFVSDIAIRVRPGATQTAIDVRSASRVGAHDFGANARRIRQFSEAAKAEASED